MLDRLPHRLRAPVLILLIAILYAVLPVSASVPPRAFAGDDDKTLGEILQAAESLFQEMKAKDYPAIWKTLTAASKRRILDDTSRAIVESGGKQLPAEELGRDFETGGPIARGYWDGFLSRFDPDLALEQSRWEMGEIRPDRAEVRITFKTADQPALLKLSREGGEWKVGLVETFWGR